MTEYEPYALAHQLAKAKTAGRRYEDESITGEVCDYERIVASVARRLKAKGLWWWADPEDLKSIGMLAVLEARPTESALIRKVAHDAIVDAIRREDIRQRGRVVVESEENDDGENYARDGWDARLIDRNHYRPEVVDRLARVWEAMKALPPRRYRVLVLRFWEGLTNEEVAQECGDSVDAVKCVVRRALADVRATLSDKRHFFPPSNGNNSRGTSKPPHSKSANAIGDK